MLKVKKINKKQSNIPMIASIDSQVSLSNFSAITPKNSCTFLGLKKQVQCENLNQKQNSNILSNQQKNSSMSSILSNFSHSSINSIYKAPTCTNHKQKQSCYYLTNSGAQPTFFCSKCSIMLASKGFIVQKIEKCFNFQTSKSSVFDILQSQRLSMKSLKQKNRKKLMKKRQEDRSQQLTSFLNNLQRSHSKLNEFNQKIAYKKQQTEEMNQVLCSKISQNFQFLHQIIEIEQKSCLQYLQKMRIQVYNIQSLPTKLINSEQSFQNNLNQMILTLENMKTDICQTYEDIVHSATDEQFQVVMSHYKQNLCNISQMLNKQDDILHQIKYKNQRLKQIGQQISNIIQLQNVLADYFEEFHQNICQQIQNF